MRNLPHLLLNDFSPPVDLNWEGYDYYKALMMVAKHPDFKITEFDRPGYRGFPERVMTTDLHGFSFELDRFGKNGIELISITHLKELMGVVFSSGDIIRGFKNVNHNLESIMSIVVHMEVGPEERKFAELEMESQQHLLPRWNYDSYFSIIDDTFYSSSLLVVTVVNSAQLDALSHSVKTIREHLARNDLWARYRQRSIPPLDEVEVVKMPDLAYDQPYILDGDSCVREASQLPEIDRDRMLARLLGFSFELNRSKYMEGESREHYRTTKRRIAKLQGCGINNIYALDTHCYSCDDHTHNPNLILRVSPHREFWIKEKEVLLGETSVKIPGYFPLQTKINW